MIRRLSRSGTLSSLYYGTIASAFSREHAAVLAGKIEYEDRHASGQQRYLLRRNVHMLEKGLSMRPRRDVFALEYIEATVAAYRSLALGLPPTSEDRELQWASDVLTAFFDTAASHPVLDAARRNFQALPPGADPRAHDGPLAPYARKLGPTSPVGFDDFLQLTEQRRSVRWFEQRPVPRPLIENAANAASLSPSACNRQPFRFRIFDDPELVQQVASIPMGTRGWVHNIPAFAVVVGDLAAFFSERDRHLIYTDSCLAAMAFVLALETQGLSTCCVNWPDIPQREEQMAKVLGLSRHQRPVMCIAMGYPDPAGLVPFSHKHAPLDLLAFN